MPAQSKSTVSSISAALRETKRDALAKALACSHWSGFDRLVNMRFGGQGTILMFHSVVSDISRQLGQSTHVQQDVLRDMLLYLRSSGWDIVSLDEGMRRLTTTQSRRFIVLTFDDGYRNNLTHALPVLEKLGAPFTVYVNSNMINGEGDVWWLGLRNLLIDQDRVDMKPMGLIFKTGNYQEKCRALLLITDWVHKDVENNSKALKGVLTDFGIDLTTIAREEMLNLNELKVLSEHELVTIGGHAETHKPLNSLSESDVYAEMLRNKLLLESTIQRSVKHFAYPFGESNTTGMREAKISESLEFESAVTTQMGNLFSHHASFPFLLPRMTVLNNDRRAQLVAKLAGVEKLFRDIFESVRKIS
jgi:peptidoglycan/xylan/chitin deacetylase (PgdA/CDA1 family)